MPPKQRKASKTTKKPKKAPVVKKNKNIQRNTNTAKVVINVGKDKSSPQPVFVQAGLPPISNTPLFNPISNVLPPPTLTATESAPVVQQANTFTQTDLTSQIADVQQRIQQFESFPKPGSRAAEAAAARQPMRSMETQVDEVQKKLEGTQTQTDLTIPPSDIAWSRRDADANVGTSTNLDEVQRIESMLPKLQPKIDKNGDIVILNPRTQNFVKASSPTGRAIFIEYQFKSSASTSK